MSLTPADTLEMEARCMVIGARAATGRHRLPGMLAIADVVERLLTALDEAQQENERLRMFGEDGLTGATTSATAQAKRARKAEEERDLARRQADTLAEAIDHSLVDLRVADFAVAGLVVALFDKALAGCRGQTG